MRRKVYYPLSLFAAIFLCSCQGQPFTEEDFTSKLFPNGVWDLIIQLGAFVILILIVFFLGYKPLKKMLKKRHDYVQGQLDEAENAKKLIAEAQKLSEQEIARGKSEAAAIIEAAKHQAEAEATLIINEAKAQASERRLAADEGIRLAQEASKAEIREQIIDVALQASSQVLGRQVQDEDESRLIGDLIDSLNGGK